MAMTVSASIQLNDMMTGPIQHITSAMNIMLSHLSVVDAQTDAAFSAAEIDTMKSELAQVDTQLADIVNKTKQEKNAQDKVNTTTKAQVHILDTVKSKLKLITGTYLGMQGIRKAFDFYGDSIDGANVQIAAETKLQTVMRQRMHATEEQINMIKQFTSEQQGIGVVGDEVQMGGAQQLATFLNSSDALRTLIPAMNNLAVQQNGVNVTSESMVNIGNLMGKVMQRQTSALTRVGVTFTEAQEKVLKYGSEQERAAMLAQVITENVGQMNAAIAATPDGKIQQVKNTWGDIKESIGMQILPYVLQLFDTIKDNLPVIIPILTGITKGVEWIVVAITNLLKGIGLVAGFFVENWNVIEPIILGIVAALIIYNATMGFTWLTTLKNVAAIAWKTVCDWAETAAIIAMTIAQDGLNAAIAACPITWIIIAIIALIAIIFAVVAVINKVTGSTLTGLGVICGAVAVVGALIYNSIVGVINSILQFLYTYFVEPFIGIIEWVLNVFNGGFNSFGDAVKNLLGQIISWFLSLGKVVTKIIDAIFGTDWTAGLTALQDNMLEWGKSENAVTLSHEAPEIPLQRVEYGNAWDAGNNFGDKIQGKINNFFSGAEFKNNPETDNAINGIEGILAGTDETADNTKETAKNTEKTNSLMELIRDNLEKKAILDYTSSTKTVTYDLSGATNIYHNTGEAFDAVKELANYLRGKEATSAEGI